MNGSTHPGELATIASVSLQLALHQLPGSPLTWLYIGDGEQAGWELSSETAWILVAAMTEVLGRLG